MQNSAASGFRRAVSLAVNRSLKLMRSSPFVLESGIAGQHIYLLSRDVAHRSFTAAVARPCCSRQSKCPRLPLSVSPVWGTSLAPEMHGDRKQWMLNGEKVGCEVISQCHPYPKRKRPKLFQVMGRQVEQLFPEVCSQLPYLQSQSVGYGSNRLLWKSTAAAPFDDCHLHVG